MIQELCDQDNSQAHELFQAWRRKHPEGFFLNCKSSAVRMLHRCSCLHPGGTDSLAEDWGSLTRRRKICSENRTELVALVEGSKRSALKICRDCNP